ncbi:NUDIX domain-containing protein [Calothrix sp. FACHB-156]|nr:NUDIX domain-containing protein [Calothrix sp. FACHB-156]
MTNLHPNIPSTPDYKAYRFPVSVKGVVSQNSKVVLLKNERDEWELPGGKLELGEEPEICVVREIEEELGLRVKIGSLLDTWIYHISEEAIVLIITYGCYPESFSQMTYSLEHKDVGLFTLEEVNILKMPQGYKKSIQKWFAILSQ